MLKGTPRSQGSSVRDGVPAPSLELSATRGPVTRPCTPPTPTPTPPARSRKSIKTKRSGSKTQLSEDFSDGASLHARVGLRSFAKLGGGTPGTGQGHQSDLGHRGGRWDLPMLAW